MANKITWADKVALQEKPDVVAENKVTAADMNQIKTAVNETIDTMPSNLKNGIAEGSLRTVGSREESGSYRLGEYAFAEGADPKASGAASPYCGGFYLSTHSAANHIYRHIIWAKIPVGYTIGDYRNAIGDGGYSEWLTDTAGTGDWYRYVYDVHAGSSGNFSTLGFVAIRANNGDNNAAVTWYVCATQVTDITNNCATYTFDANGTAEYFYAPVAYNITYDANGGSNAPSTQVKTYGQNLVLSSQIPTYNGYDFIGWAQAGEDTIYSPGQTLSSDLSRYSGATITFYAVWV